MNRRKRKARLIRTEDGKALIQFIPGGHYWLHLGYLFTGVHQRPASEAIRAKLTDHARRAFHARGEWVL